MLFTAVSDCFVSRVTSHAPVCLLLVPFNNYFSLFWADKPCLYSLIVHPLSHKNPNDISGSVFIFGKMWIFLA